MSDIETYFHLAQEETDDAQRASLLEDVAKEIAAADAYVSDLETKTLLAGENDRLNAIVTIKPGAGGTESQDWAEMLLRMYCAGRSTKGFARRSSIRRPAKKRASSPPPCRSKARTPTACSRRKRRAPPGPHFAVRPGRAAAHVVRIGLRDSRN